MSTTPNILILWTDQQRGDCLGAVNPAIRTPNLDGLTADSTLIVFHSDHGELLNQFGIWGKGVLYRGATHVPLMVKLPGQHTHRRYGHPVGQVDLLPTLLDALGLDAPAGLPGRSLLPACTGAELPARDAFIEWEESRDTPALDPLTSAAERVEASQRWHTAAATGDPAAHRRRASWRCVVTPDGWRYAASSAGERELYDLCADPAERRNLAADQAHAGRAADLHARVAAWQASTGDFVKLPAQ